MKKIIIEIILLLIPFKDIRNRWRRILRDFSLSNIKNFYDFSKRTLDNKTVLLFEPNDCHAEVLPGFAKYFIDLDYDVDILTSRGNIEERPFCRFQDKINIFCLNPFFIGLLRFSKIINKYKYILVTSSNWYSWKVQTTRYFGIDKRKNTIVVEHDTNDIKRFKEEKLIKNNKLITLWNFDKGLMINPNYFGDIKIHSTKNEIVNFVVIGNIEKQRKNYDLLINVVKELSKITDKFKITVIGKGNLEVLENDYKKFVDIKGRLDFPSLYCEMDKADFFLSLLDYENKDHHRYITSGVSGSIQLILGFRKPAIIQEDFAKFYGFNETNSIVYMNNNEMINSMKKAISITNNEYSQLTFNIDKKLKEIKDKSKNNLLRSINE